MNPQKPNILVVGASGSGKSTSLRNLNPETTAILNYEQKAFPFKGGGKFKYNTHISTKQQGDQVYGEFNSNPEVEVIVKESFTSFSEQTLQMCRSMFKGFDIYERYSQFIFSNLITHKQSQKQVIYFALDEILSIEQATGTSVSARRCATEGKKLNGRIEKEFVIVLFTEVVKQADGKFDYFFVTQSDGITSAKSPMEMFGALKIDNDLAKVLEVCNEYYK